MEKCRRIWVDSTKFIFCTCIEKQRNIKSLRDMRNNRHDYCINFMSEERILTIPIAAEWHPWKKRCGSAHVWAFLSLSTPKRMRNRNALLSLMQIRTWIKLKKIGRDTSRTWLECHAAACVFKRKLVIEIGRTVTPFPFTELSTAQSIQFMKWSSRILLSHYTKSTHSNMYYHARFFHYCQGKNRKSLW